MSILDKVNSFYNTYKTIAIAAIAIASILGILTVGYTYVQKADANELAIKKETEATNSALKEIREQYTPMPFAIDIRISATKNARQTRLNSLEISKSSKEKRRDRLKDKHPNIKNLPDDNTTKEEYTELVGEIKDLKKKIIKIEEAIEAETE
ncbi:MAG: hypothetical protein KAJ19_29305 [Gammaproteobacteria bacterium]|nr:hypothetical protein [Gammaproteobacteria bacterium]